MNLHQLAWQHPDQPILSGLMRPQPWSTVELYNPTVVFARGLYRMWYLGTNVSTRSHEISLGYAESADGLNWQPHAANPILTPGDLPVEGGWHTPHVLYDDARDVFRMWFTIGRYIYPDGVRDLTQQLGYAESEDGLNWNVHPQTLGESIRRPCVLPDGSGGFRMWANASPTGEDFQKLVHSIFHFTSPDGLNWTRDARPCVASGGPRLSVVYPCVVRAGGGFVMWTGAHVRDDSGGYFEIYSATSDDGLKWNLYDDKPAFAATRSRSRFDGRYVSTPSVIVEADRALMYYSARDLDCLYPNGDGTIGHDSQGIYRHIAVATCEF